MSGHVASDAAKDSSQTLHPLVADDDHVGVQCLCSLDQRVRRIAFRRRVLDLKVGKLASDLDEHIAGNFFGELFAANQNLFGSDADLLGLEIAIVKANRDAESSEKSAAVSRQIADDLRKVRDRVHP